MATFNLEEFQSAVRTKGLAEVNRFEMQITAPPTIAPEEARLVSLFCEISNFPPLNMMVRPLNIYGPMHQRPISLDYGGDGIAASFYIDQNMNVKAFFENWIWSISNPYTHNISYQNEYAVPIEISQLDREDRPVYSIELEEAFPRSINLIDLNNSAQNQVHRLTVVFAYRKWRVTRGASPQINREAPGVNLSTSFLNTPGSEFLRNTQQDDGSYPYYKNDDSLFT